MTGTDVKKLREESLGWTGAQFASLFGVHPSTVYRWEEQGEADLKTEPLQLQLLGLLQTTLPLAAGLSDALKNALALGGSLRALYVLLSSAYKHIPESEDDLPVQVVPLVPAPEVPA